MSGSNASDMIGRYPDRRKLIAVVYADMVGYSRLIGLDDAGTLERLGLAPQPDRPGDSGAWWQDRPDRGPTPLLIVFDSIDGAVRCAVNVQQQVPIHDGDQPLDRAIRFRVGVNIGDAIADGTDLHGDVVNVAARLQAECPPGGICVSRSVRDHVHGRLDLTFNELGALSLKNIARPIEAFLVGLDGTLNVTSSGEGAFMHRAPRNLPLPDKPLHRLCSRSTNMSGDPEQDYFSDGVTESIITELSRIRWLFVIARNSSFTYKGHAVDLVRQVARLVGCTLRAGRQRPARWRSRSGECSAN